MRRFVLFMLLALLTPAFAQQPDQKQSAPVNDFSGMYSFTKEGEFVQINLEDQAKVTGYISRFGDLPSDEGSFLDQFFKTATTDGTKLEFTTEKVHGAWFEFQGTVGRGPGKTPNEEAYYVIKGKLMKYSTDAEKKVTAQSREIELKSFPQDVGMEPQERR
jgi:hypothetical protein